MDRTDFEEQEIEDKVWCVNPIGDNQKIFVIHQAAQRFQRKDIVLAMKKNIKELDSIDIDELLEKIETDYVHIEDGFLQLFQQDENVEEDNRVPVFDFEIN
jgi:hypothetical protein